jgi:hypothetical protein
MLDYLFGSLGPFFQGLELSQKSKQRKSEAISLIRDAIRYTEKFVDDNDVNSEDNYTDKESTILADKWSKAAVAIRPFDNEAAQVFENKSDYWMNPYGFMNDLRDGTRRRDMRIGLENVKRIIAHFERIWR